MFEKMLNSPNIHIVLQTDYKKLIADLQYDQLYITSSIDEYFDYKYGTLEYRKTLFHFETYDQQAFQENIVINYPNDYEYTRITEMKKFYPQSSTYNIKKTVICKEFP
jgi:UDP-galactopyranose mutase